MPRPSRLLKVISFEIPGVPDELIQPIGIDFSKDGKLAFVALGPANRVAVIDTATYEVKDYILVGQRPWHLELNPDGSKLYVANGLTNDMTVIDVATLEGGEVSACRAFALGRSGNALTGALVKFPARSSRPIAITCRTIAETWQSAIG